MNTGKSMTQTGFWNSQAGLQRGVDFCAMSVGATS
jgi:hypothetical protein